MKTERFQWLAAVIAAHENRQLIGRTRLQKEVYLLQRLGMPSDYVFRMHHYGPYSEGVQADINLLERFGFVHESPSVSQDGAPYSTFTATPAAELGGMAEYSSHVSTLAAEPALILELAATFDAFRQRGLPEHVALALVRHKKGAKCDEGRLQDAIDLLMRLHLHTPAN